MEGSRKQMQLGDTSQIAQLTKEVSKQVTQLSFALDDIPSMADSAVMVDYPLRQFLLGLKKFASALDGFAHKLEQFPSLSEYELYIQQQQEQIDDLAKQLQQALNHSVVFSKGNEVTN